MSRRGSPTGDPWARIPECLLYDKELKAWARLIYGALLRHADHQGVCWPSQERLAGLLGCSPRNIRRGLEALVETGWVEVKEPGHGKRASVYVVKVPYPTPPSGAPAPHNKQVAGRGRPTTDALSGQKRPSFGAKMTLFRGAGVHPTRAIELEPTNVVARTRTRTREDDTGDDATRNDVRDSKNEDQDPLAVRLAAVIGKSYVGAKAVVDELRAGDIGDLLIDQAIGMAAKAGEEGEAPATYAWVKSTARALMAERVQGWAPERTIDPWSDSTGYWTPAPEPVGLRSGLEQLVGLRGQLPPRKDGSRLDPSLDPAPESDHESDHEVTPAAGVPHRDPLTDHVFLAVEGAAYDEAAAVIARLRAAGVGDDTIARAVAAAERVGNPDLGYVEAVAADRADRATPAPSANGTHANGGAA